MKRSWYWLAVLLLTLAVSACAAPAAPVSRPSPSNAPAAAPAAPPVVGQAATSKQQVLDAARKEGEVAVWGNTFDAPDEVLKAFRERYPFIKVKLWDADTGDGAIVRLVEERQAGRVTADILILNEGDIGAAVRNGVVQEYDWKNAGWPNQPPHKFYINYASNGRTAVYNTNVIPIAEGPKSWEDLALPKWRDRSPLASSSGAEISMMLAYLWRENSKLNWDKSEKFLTDVVKNNRPRVMRGFTTPLQLLSSGEFGIILISSVSSPLRMIQKGAPLELVPLGKTSGNNMSAAMAKGASHPNAASIFADWWATEGYLFKARVDSVFVFNPAGAKVAPGNQMLSMKYKTDLDPMPTEYYTPENTKRAVDFWNQVLGVK